MFFDKDKNQMFSNFIIVKTLKTKIPSEVGFFP